MEPMLEETKLPRNVEGKFFVGDECDGCAYCGGIAPNNFEFDKPTNTYFVARQPRTDNEKEMVLEAMEDCPVDAIKVDEKS